MSTTPTTTTKIDFTEFETQAQAADEAGFTKVAAELRTKADRGRRMVLAYEHFRVVKPEHIEAFNAKLKQKTERPLTPSDTQYRYGYNSTICDQLVFEALDDYGSLPPADVIAKVKDAKDRKIFDNMEVAHVAPVATHVKLPDPIVFGRIDGCPDRFFIAQWDNDVDINDLVGKHGG